MRSFEERKAEVLLRSEQRIAAAKKTKRRIFAICTLCFVCIASLSVMFLPDMFAKDKGASSDIDYYNETDEFDEYTTDTANGSLTSSFSALNVKTADGKTKTSEDDDVILDVYHAICAITENSKAGGIKSEPSDKGADPNYKGSEGHCSIVFQLRYGGTVSYTLEGDILTNEKTGEKFSLSDTEAKKLKETLNFK